MAVYIGLYLIGAAKNRAILFTLDVNVTDSLCMYSILTVFEHKYLENSKNCIKESIYSLFICVNIPI